MLRHTIAIATLLSLCLPTSAQLLGPMERLSPMLGTWNVSGTWAWGATVDARATYTAGVNNRFLTIRTWVSDNKEPEYLRYESTVSHDAATETYSIFSAKFDGTTTTATWELEEREGTDVWISTWNAGETVVREELSMGDATTMRWLVEMRSGPDAAWETALDATWMRAQEEATKETSILPERVIDARDFAETNDDPRPLTKEVTIDAPRTEVYRAWPDAEAFKAAYAPESETLRANIELAVGGRYEWLFDGETGSNGCQVLCYLPDEMVAFTWNAPPTLSTRGTPTWVVVRLADADDSGTRVTLTHAGFGQGEDWDATRAYFDKAWDHVLSQFTAHLATD